MALWRLLVGWLITLIAALADDDDHGAQIQRPVPVSAEDRIRMAEEAARKAREQVELDALEARKAREIAMAKDAEFDQNTRNADKAKADAAAALARYKAAQEAARAAAFEATVREEAEARRVAAVRARREAVAKEMEARARKNRKPAPVAA
mmetsp:Transcript_18947/g.42980  ORF Transcript_18947/g.42980 Transcript_18947/m.42980 type:complete len:151 (+) Transcript_18947:64-516(+)